MTSTYPVFVQGQTLTAPALNGILGFGNALASSVGVNVGFGISSGFSASVEGRELVVQPGTALDQAGRPINSADIRREPLPGNRLRPLRPGRDRIDPVRPLRPARDRVDDLRPGRDPIDPLRPDRRPFDFVDDAVPGWSAVIDLDEQRIPHAEECGDGCTQHAEQWSVTPRLQFVRGRLIVGDMPLEAEPIFNLGFVSITIGGAVTGSARDIVGAIDGLLGGDLDGPRRKRLLDEIPIANGDVAGVKAYKAGVVNDLLVAAVDYARLFLYLEGLHRRSTTTTPGVVLGWLEPVADELVWRPRWRHGWLPSEGMLTAIFGRETGNLLQPRLARIVAIIDNFSPPKPAPADPDPGRILVWPGKVAQLPERIPFTPTPRLTERVKLPPEPPEVEWYYPPKEEEEWWKRPQPDWRVDLFKTVGRRGELVQPKVEEQLLAEGFHTKVDVMTVEQAAKVPGVELALVAEPADRLLLVTDATGLVVNTARVPAAIAVAEVPAVVNEVGAIGVELRTELAASIATFVADFGTARDEVTMLVDQLGARVIEAETLVGDVTKKQVEIGASFDTTLALLSGPNVGRLGPRQVVGIDPERTELIAKALEQVQVAVEKIAEKQQVEIPERLRVQLGESVGGLRERREVVAVETALRTVEASLEVLGAARGDLTRLRTSIDEIGRLGGLA
ncbi:MAG: hypothetical protein ACRDT9_10020 [Agromyces sp.]